MTLRGLLLPCLLMVAVRPAGGAPGQTDVGGALQPSRLRCEYLTDPLGIDVKKPRLSWIVASDQRQQMQTAYQIVVASSPARLTADEGDLWDSGRVASDRTTFIVYGGAPLTSRVACFWRVRVWDEAGRPSDWSPVARWSMGLLEPEDWTAGWISYPDREPLTASQQQVVLPPARYYRQTFTAEKPIRRATAYAAALGIYDLHVNGRRIGDQMFAPGWCDYKQRSFYNAYDVTDQLRSGRNAIGAIVADGWYAGYVGYGLLVGYGPHRCGRYFYGKTPALRIQLEVDYEDGSRQCIATDATWQWNTGGYLEADMLMGETYDARLEPTGWDTPDFDDAGWQAAISASDNGSQKADFFDQGGQREVELGFEAPPVMQAHPGVPVRPTEELRPVGITRTADGKHLFDLGQNFAGVVRLKATGPAGTRIVLRYGEMLHPDGRLMTENLRRARATDTFILRGDADGEVYQSRFTYHGFQFVELSGYPGEPGMDDLTGIAVHSDTPLTSSFECSDPVLNRFFRNVVWTQRANFLEIPTDCPQRDERLGWMGDAQIYVRAASYNADVGAFFTKWIQDVREAQTAQGAYPDYCPYPMQHGGSGKPYGTAWMDAGIICPWTIHQVYGDRRMLEEHYDSMQRFLEFRQDLSPDGQGTAPGNPWGDWLSLGETTPIEYVDQIYFAESSRLMFEIARTLDKQDDAARYRALFQRIRQAFADRYVRPDGTLNVDTQTAYVLAIAMNMIPEELRQAAGDRLAAKIRANESRMTTGFLGTRPLLPVLTETGHFELAAQMLQSRRFPSWGYEVVNGATSVWERWNSYTRDQGFMNPAMNSFSHYAFGAVCEWMFDTLAGIDTDGPGYGSIRIRPRVPTQAPLDPGTPGLDWVKAEYDSIRGPIRVEWRRENSTFHLAITVPANTTATVRIPAAAGTQLCVNGDPLPDASGVQSLGAEPDAAIVKVGSGHYRFESALPVE